MLKLFSDFLTLASFSLIHIALLVVVVLFTLINQHCTWWIPSNSAIGALTCAWSHRVWFLMERVSYGKWLFSNCAWLCIQQEGNAVFLYALPARVMMRKLFVIILYHIILWLSFLTEWHTNYHLYKSNFKIAACLVHASWNG